MKYIRIGGIEAGPRPKMLYKQDGINGAVYESSPWSKSSPNGPDSPILRANLPSTPSNVYARKIFIAASNQNQFGTGDESS